MAFPDGVQVVTLTAGAAGYRTLDGTIPVGSLRFTPSVPRVVSAEHGVIALGYRNATIGASGEFTVDLLANDAAGFQPSGWTYRVDEEFSNAPGRAYNISLPAAVPEVTLAELVPVDASDGSSVWVPPGGATPSGTVTAATSYGLSSSAGAAAEYSRGDHTHGTPAAPTTGTTAGTYAAGDDSRITGAAQKAQNLADLSNASTARSNLGLGGAAVLNVGTSSGTVAAGDDSRITGAAQKASNLADLASAGTARSNLGLGGAALLSVGTGAGTVAAGNDTRITGALQAAQNLADVASPSTARTSLGLGGAAVLSVGTSAGTVAAGDDSRVTGAAQKAQNLADLADVSTARTNLGLGGAAVLNVGSGAGTVAAGNDSRLSDARTPTAHAASHGSGGGDAVTVAQSQVTGLSASLAALLPLAGGTMSGGTTINVGTAGALAIGGGVSGDTFDRWRVLASGTLELGPGGAAVRDTFVRRLGANSLSTDGAFTVGTTLTVGGTPLWTPAKQGLKGWAFDPVIISSSAAAAVAGTFYMSLIELTDSGTLTTLYWDVATVASGVTSGQNFVCMVNPSGTIVGSVGVDADIVSTGLKATTISVPYTAGGWRAGFLFNATTPPALARCGAVTGSVNAVNVNITGAALRGAINGTGLTALPGSVTLSSNGSGSFHWAAAK
ncbi:hypothetical protein ACWD25_35475 [Streptomyces sp. NPDC002920]